VSQEGPKSTAEANILARLFKSTPVQKEIPGIMAGIRKLLRVDDAPGKAKESDSKETKSNKKATKTADESDSESERPKSERGEQVSRANDMEITDEEGPDEDMAQFDGRLAPGSDSEAEADSESGDEDEENDISDSISRSPSPSFSAENSPAPKKSKVAKGSAAPVQTTTFLPSLMAGGYWSGSEEATDEEESQPKRKNRMGQQARRALWEKKYGAGANHVKQEAIAAKYGGRDNGWDTKRGATDGGRGRGGKRGGFGGGFGRAHRDESGPGGKPSKPKPTKKDSDGPLHPSWEAKRKAKEQAPATFAGKKMTFD
jgi:hypothetical protein